MNGTTLGRMSKFLVLLGVFLVACKSDASPTVDESLANALRQDTETTSETPVLPFVNSGVGASAGPFTIARSVSNHDFVVELEITEIGDARWNTMSGELPPNLLQTPEDALIQEMFVQYQPVVMRVVETYKPSNVVVSDPPQHYVVVELGRNPGPLPPSPFGSSKFGDIGDRGILFANHVKPTQVVDPDSDSFFSVLRDMAEERTTTGGVPHEVIIQETWFLFSGNDAIEVRGEEGGRTLPIADLRQQILDAIGQQ
jgi:hypothetical protein